jgi:4,5-dihydroxyphthalate decarboxylase
MSVSSLVIATSNAPTAWVAVPVFTMRHFFHTSVLVRKAAGIEKPGDLKGKRVGVPEYQQTWAVWSRGIFADEFGVQPKDNTWYMERLPEKSHGGATGFTAPPGVEFHYIPPTTNMGEMMVKGELDATVLYLPEKNLIDRSVVDLEGRDDIGTLFPDPAAEAKRYYTKTGMYPINHTLVVRRSLLEREPWIARSLYDALTRAKALARSERDGNLEPFAATGVLDSGAREALARDMMPYGVVAARRELETIARYDFEQGLAKRLVGLEELFAPDCMNL